MNWDAIKAIGMATLVEAGFTVPREDAQPPAPSNAPMARPPSEPTNAPGHESQPSALFNHTVPDRPGTR